MVAGELPGHPNGLSAGHRPGDDRPQRDPGQPRQRRRRRHPAAAGQRFATSPAGPTARARRSRSPTTPSPTTSPRTRAAASRSTTRRSSTSSTTRSPATSPRRPPSPATASRPRPGCRPRRTATRSRPGCASWRRPFAGSTSHAARASSASRRCSTTSSGTTAPAPSTVGGLRDRCAPADGSRHGQQLGHGRRRQPAGYSDPDEHGDPDDAQADRRRHQHNGHRHTRVSTNPYDVTVNVLASRTYPAFRQAAIVAADPAPRPDGRLPPGGAGSPAYGRGAPARRPTGARVRHRRTRAGTAAVPGRRATPDIDGNVADAGAASALIDAGSDQVTP